MLTRSLLTRRNRTTRSRSPFASPPFRLLGLLLTLALAAAACGGDDEDPVAGGETDGEGTSEAEGPETTEPRQEGEPVQGGSITVGLEAETSGWRPGTGSFASSGYNVLYTMLDPLMARTVTGTVEPYLAESLEPNDDFSEWTLTLREGVMFHDGTPLNAQAIKDNFDIYLTAPGSNVAGVLGNVESFEVTGDLTGVYMLAEGNAAFPDLLTTSAGHALLPHRRCVAGRGVQLRAGGHRPLPVRVVEP